MMAAMIRDYHGFGNPRGLRVGYAGVGVGVAKAVPWQNPYPQCGLRVTLGVTRDLVIVLVIVCIFKLFVCHMALAVLTHNNNNRQ
jgi:hypothetical protein